MRFTLKETTIDKLDNFLEKFYPTFVYGVAIIQFLEILLFIVGILAVVLNFFGAIDFTWLKAFTPMLIAVGSLLIRQLIGMGLIKLSDMIE